MLWDLAILKCKHLIASYKSRRMSDKKEKSKESKREKVEVKEKSRDKGQKIKGGESTAKAEVKAKCKEKTQKRKHDETSKEVPKLF